MTQIAIVDLGLGNIGSVEGAFSRLGASTQLINHPSKLPRGARIVLPGVGNYGHAMGKVRAQGWDRVLLSAEVPVLGICLGMQLLADSGTEGGPTGGVGAIAGSVTRLAKSAALPLPHMGWNSVWHTGDKLFAGIPSGADFYFAHSFGYSEISSGSVIATAAYANPFPAAVRSKSFLGVQFHPEKSSHWGLMLLSNFLGSD